LVLFLLVIFISLSSYADVEIAVKGLMKNSAVVVINGKQRVLKVGKTSPEGVTLISANSKEAVVEINGELHTMGMSKNQGIKYTESTPNEFRIAQGYNGHFYTTGLINNSNANFVVDTGASAIALSEVEAKRLGLSYIDAERIPVSTASSADLGYVVNLTSVTVGSITIFNVEAVILPGEFPEVILLGNSFLGRVNYQVDSGVMVLEAKF
jgi:aspartyl protease family protein